MSGVNTLIDMGFPENRAHKAWSVMGHRGVQAAMDWLLEHMEDEDIDDPLPASDVTMHHAADNETPAANSRQENAESQISREERTRLLQEKINQKRQENEELEKQRQRESEIRRRKEGQDLSKIKAEMEQKEMQKLVEERKREKRDDRLARQRVKDQIAQDRADKKAREAAAKQTTPKKTIVADAVPPELATSKYSEAKLQIRLMDGSKLNHTFSANDQLSAVRLYVDMNRTDAPGGESFDLMTAFPKKLFTREEYDVPLHLLGLTPSAVVMVTKPHDAPSRHDSIQMASGDERADN